MIFDLDGVLVHSMPLHVAAWQGYLESLGIRVENLETRMHGKRNSELVRDMIGTGLTADVIFEHGASKERLFRELMMAGNLEDFRMAGLTEFLELHNDVPKAIGSNAEPENIDFVLDRFGLLGYFQAIVNGMQVKRPKPFPDIYLAAAKLLGVQPENCIVFEDSPTGVEAALAAGMRVVGIESTPTDFKGVDLKVADFSDPRLKSWLAEQSAL